MVRWIALFSQTGSEIVDISKELGRWPDRIITNNENLDKINPELHDKKLAIHKHKEIEQMLKNISEYEGRTIVTLHGYLRILSPDVCDLNLEIYNGHPGLINEYPELKGKDPQERVIGNDYDLVGSVVHRVTAGVDEGSIVYKVAVKNVATTLEEVYNTLRFTSKKAWLHFLGGKL